MYEDHGIQRISIKKILEETAGTKVNERKSMTQNKIAKIAKNQESTVLELAETFLLLENKQEALNFLKDLCTPQELSALAERWKVCKLLHKGELSYREIQHKTGASLTTIGRVARFLKTEPYNGYRKILERENQ